MSFLALGNSQIGNAVPGWCAAGGYSLPVPTFQQTLILVTTLPSRVAFGATALGLAVELIYPIPTSVAFGQMSITQQSYISVFLNGVDVSTSVLVGTIQIVDSLSQPTTASFSMWVPKANIVPQVGQQVTIYLKNQRIFGGYVDQPFQTAFQAMPGFGFLGTAGGSSGGTSSATGSTSSSGGGAVACTDYSSLLARRYAGLYFDGNGSPVPSFLTNIVQYIVETYLAADGFTYQDSDGDPNINLGPVLFNWVTIQAAFNTLSSMTGWDWNVDQYQVIRFFPSASGMGSAPFNINEGDGNAYGESLGVEYYRSKYRNRQGVASPSQQGQLWQDIFSVSDPGPFPNFPQPPDGVRKTFLQLYGFTSVPIVLVDGNPQVVAQLTGSGYVPATGWQWYIVQPQPGFPSYGLFQFGGNAALGPSDTLIIEYQTPIAPILWLENATQIADRAAIEGNSGVYEDVEQAPSTTDPAAIMAYCAGLLARYSNGIPFQVTYSSRNQLGLFTGQLQTIITSNPPLNFTGLISAVTWQDIDGEFMQLSVTVLSGEYQGDFTQFFAALVAGTQLVQPANSAAYQWGPISTGVQNFVSPQVSVVLNAVESIMRFSVNFTTANPAPCDMTFSLLDDGNVIYQVTVPNGFSGSFVEYPTNGLVKMYAGDVITVQVFFAVLFVVIADVTVNMSNVVYNT